MNTVRFSQYAAKNPGALAVIDATGQHWSRGTIADRANRLSRALCAAAFEPGDVLAIIAPNCAEYLIVYLAATQVGLYVVPVNWHLAPPEMQFILENCAARACVVHARFGSTITSILSQVSSRPPVRISLGGAIPHFTELDEATRGFDHSALPDPVQGRPLSYTSATTGKPKGVVLPLADASRVLDLGINSRIAVGTLPEAHVQLCASMLYHGAPLETASIGLHMGHVVILTDHLMPEKLLELIDRHRVTYLYMVPTTFRQLLALGDAVRAKYSTGSLTRVIHGGAACPVDVKRKIIQWWGPILWESYGSTEGGGTLAGSVDWLRYPGTVGRPIPGTRLLIVGENGEELAAGEPGVIYMTRYCGDRFEYLGDVEKTRASYRGEFFTVGDIGYVNEEGFLFLCDRKIDMINLGGTKVYPAEVESVLLRHPFVADCAVFGVPDPIQGEAIMAVIQPSEGAPASPRELKAATIRFLSEQLSTYKLPRYVEFAADLGRDATGKLQKKRLRERYTARESASCREPDQQ